jgi:hypothetical protein
MSTRRHLNVERGASERETLADFGRILYAEDIQVLYGKHSRGPRKGKWRHSLQWIWANVAPTYRQKHGKTPYWFEADVIRWMKAQREGDR